MARKKRKSSAGKRKKKSKALTRKKSRAPARKRKLRERRQTLGDKVSRAYHTVVDTIKDTDRLRNKMELPATSETE
jgi:hypothetical protein